MGVFDANGKLKVSGLAGGSSSGGGVEVLTALPASPSTGDLVSVNEVVYWYTGATLGWKILEEGKPNPYSEMKSSLCLWLEWTSNGLGNVDDWQDLSPNEVTSTTTAGTLVLSRNGVRFDGTSTISTIPDAAYFDATTNLTIGFAGTPDVVSGNRVPVAKSATGSGAWSIQTNGSTMRFHCGTPGSNFGESTNNVLVSDVSNNYIWVYDGSQTGNANRLKLYVNGSEEALTFTGTIPSALTATTNDITLGAYSNSAQYWDGPIHAVAMSLSSLTAVEVANLAEYFVSTQVVRPDEDFRPAGFYTTATTAFYRSAAGIAPGAGDFIAIAIVVPTTDRDNTGYMPIMSNKNFATPAGWTFTWAYGPLVLNLYGSGGPLEVDVPTAEFSFDANKGKSFALGVRMRNEAGTGVGEIWIGPTIYAATSLGSFTQTPSTGGTFDLGGGSFFSDERGPCCYFLGAGYYEGRISEMEMTQLMGFCQKYQTLPANGLDWDNLWLSNNVKTLPTSWYDSSVGGGTLTKQGSPTGVDSLF